MRTGLLSILAGVIGIFLGVTLPSTAQAVQCLRVVDPSGFVAQVSWYSSGSISYTYNESKGTYEVPTLGTAISTELLALGMEDCFFDIVTQEPAIAVVSIVGGEYADGFVKFMLNSTIGLASGTLSGATCALFMGCPAASFVAGRVSDELKKVTVDKLPAYKSIIYIGSPSSYRYTNIRGSIYNPEVIEDTQATATFDMAPKGVMEDVWLSYFAPARQGVLQGALPLRSSENVNLGTCAMLCHANQANLGCQGFNYNTETLQCQTVTFPAVGQPCVSYVSASATSFYRSKSAPEIRFADCSVTQEQDMQRQMDLELSREQ
jgi:hypothetical protein